MHRLGLSSPSEFACMQFTNKESRSHFCMLLSLRIMGRTSSTMSVCFLLLFKMVNVIGQPGFISIDCGNPSPSNYSDPNTGIVYVADDEFISTGTNYNISSSYITSSLEKQLLNVRSFPNGTRNCYDILSVTQNSKYLVRATFMHGNYDGLQRRVEPTKPLQFHLYIDVNFWKIVNITDASKTYRAEAVAVALADSMSVCLINIGSGTPFISALELRLLKDYNYRYANTTQYLVLVHRKDAGSTSSNEIRYPADPYDRIWSPWTLKPDWSVISTDSKVKNYLNDETDVPSAVMQTANVPANSSVMSFNWFWEDAEVPGNEFYAHVHMTELVPNVSRSFNIYLNDRSWQFNVTPPYLMAFTVFSTAPLTSPSLEYSWAFNSTGLSKLPPILNAMEVHSPMYLTEVATDASDVVAINAIRERYKVERNWVSDPCAPRKYAWDRLSCSYTSSFPRIVSVDLSLSALSGDISSSFSMLTELKYLDLSYNNLTGEIPDSLGSLLSLQVLNLTGNHFARLLPVSLLEKSKSGRLLLVIDDNTQLCTNATSCLPQDNKKKISTPIVVILSVVPAILIFLVILLVWRCKKSRGLSSKENTLKVLCRDNNVQLESRQFTYTQLSHISGNFARVIGQGGFGFVYHGYLEPEKQVAIKMCSQSSKQGTKEFLAEAQNLTKVHHRNLVSLVGYCMDEKHLALVYEYMANGSLLDRLRGKAAHLRVMSWGDRLRIAVQAAQGGLEYLHKGCKPSIIHRDIKSSNILLSEDMEAKIADFGLSRAFQSDDQTHVSTAVVVGTPGYVDPEYHNTLQLNEKSDVYSFGVVLLELITGKPPIIQGDLNVHIVQYVASKLTKGELEVIVDERLQGKYNSNSVWKVLDLALRCTEQTSNKRPSMSDVVTQLKESSELEPSCSGSKNTTDEVFGISQISVLEIEDIISGPHAR